jgi:AcrR family transcriptional regulator
MKRNSFVPSTDSVRPRTDEQGKTPAKDLTMTTTTRTRPRVEGEREAEIHRAVLAELIESGYDKLTFDAVAGAVRASKATLYRRWPTKSEMVIDALVATRCSEAAEVPDTGTLRGDLLELACVPGGLSEDLSALIGAIIPALHRDPELFKAFHEQFIGPKMAQALEVFERARDRGEVGPGADLEQLAKVLPALCTHEEFVFKKYLTPEDIASLVDAIVLPACRATRRDD